MKEKDKAFHKAFGKHVSNLIREREINPETVAARGGIETKAVYRILNAEHSPTLSMLRAIAKGLDTGLPELVTFDFEEKGEVK